MISCNERSGLSCNTTATITPTSSRRSPPGSIHGTWRRPARLIHVHYNTLKNRLERIEGIIGPVLEDSARALECEVAIYVYRHYDGTWTART